MLYSPILKYNILSSRVMHSGHEQSYQALKEIRETYPQLDVIVDLATTFGCPFEGKFPASRVVEFLKDYVDLGIREVCLCDTIGIANPGQVRDILRAVQQAYPQLELQVHIHVFSDSPPKNIAAAKIQFE